MRSLLSIAILLMAGGAGYAQSPYGVVMPGYGQYSRPHYYDYEVYPYVGRRAVRPPSVAQAVKRKPEAAAAPARQAPAALPAMVETSPRVAAQPAGAPPRAGESPATAVAPVAPPPPAAQREDASVAREMAAALPAAASAKPPATPAAEPAAPAPQAVTPPPAAPVTPVADKKPEKKPEVIAALSPTKQDTEARPKPSAISPFGVWSASDGQMRVEPCGKSICSYAVGGEHAGKMILRHMRPAGDNRWVGQVTDVRSGQVYSATVTMRGPNALNLQGCALGGLVCGGQTFTRGR